MTDLALNQVDLDGQVAALVAASASGDTAAVGDDCWVEFENTSGAPIVVTLDSVRPSDYGTDENVTVSVPALAGGVNGRAKSGPLGRTRFRNTTDGRLHMTYSTHTGLKVGSFTL